jgi:hypothetical protein
MIFSIQERELWEKSTSHVTNIYVNFAKQQRGEHKAGTKNNSLLSVTELMLNTRDAVPLNQ